VTLFPLMQEFYQDTLMRMVKILGRTGMRDLSHPTQMVLESLGAKLVERRRACFALERMFRFPANAHNCKSDPCSAMVYRLLSVLQKYTPKDICH